MKIAMPLMLAWWFQRREGQLRALDFVIAALLLLVPVGLIVKQPDLGTAMLVLAAGFYVIFFAGLSWKLIMPVVLLGAAAIAAVVVSRTICQPDVKWPMLHDYQRNRVCTLLDPTHRSARQGLPHHPGEIAIGSGGIIGKGWHEGHADAPRVHPRAHHRLHLRRLLRGVRPGRHASCCCSLRAS